MSDNISRKAAKDEIAEKVFHDLTDEFYGVMQVLDELPSTDRTGHWIMGGEPPWYVRECSECGKKWLQWSRDRMPNFCSECGADMRGVDDDSTL